MSAHEANEVASAATSTTHVSGEQPTVQAAPVSQGTCGEGESAIPADKVEEKIEAREEDWEHDPINPRNWSFSKKWIAVSIVGSSPSSVYI